MTGSMFILYIVIFNRSQPPSLHTPPAFTTPDKDKLKMRLRIRGPLGQKPVVLDNNATIGDLKKAILDCTSLKSYDIKYGYPPQKLELDSYQDKDSISPLKLDGEQLIISDNQPQSIPAKQVPVKPKTAAPLSLSRKQASKDPPEIPVPSHGATLVLRIMPDDNSCLFRAFNSAYFGAMDNMHELRSIIAQTIQSNKETYSEVVLEKSPDKYCQWIQNPDAWGGSIELQILSKQFDIEICSIDVQTLRVDIYNEGMAKRCVLVYSGIHYDCIALSPSDPPFDKSYAPPEFDTKVFEAYDEEILIKSKELCKALRGQGYFTDTAGFTLRCNICGEGLIGEKAAVEHASHTGHTDFGEA